MVLCCSCVVLFSQETPDKTKHATVILYRPHQLLGCALKMKVTVNDTVLILKNKGIQELEISPEHAMVATKGSEHSILLKSEETYYFRLHYDFNFLFGKPVAIQVTKEQAQKELQRLLD